MVEGEDITLSYLECPELAKLDPEPKGIPVPDILNPVVYSRLYADYINDMHVAAKFVFYGGFLTLVPIGIVTRTPGLPETGILLQTFISLGVLGAAMYEDA